MKLQVLSDLHLDFRNDLKPIHDALRNCGADVLVLAGDTCELRNPRNAYEYYAPICDMFEVVLFVNGNHEHFHLNGDAVNDICVDLRDRISNLGWLNNSTSTIAGHKFYGGTFWYDVDGMLDTSWKEFIDSWNILGSKKLIRKAHSEFVKNANKMVDSDTIVISHNAPHRRSIAPMFAGSELNQFFVTPNRILSGKQPKLWVHGHTHSPFDYKEGNTRVMCLPLGYPREQQCRPMSLGDYLHTGLLYLTDASKQGTVSP